MELTRKNTLPKEGKDQKKARNRRHYYMGKGFRGIDCGSQKGLPRSVHTVGWERKKDWIELLTLYGPECGLSLWPVCAFLDCAAWESLSAPRFSLPAPKQDISKAPD
ncbi:hypothetical protein CRG98_050295 [Punica granatum]|uniref:Uncharacterized protein n=1 Tax=Punica granatum TaxID=22663 RepID=A0A2I0GKM2_PUNGR|nr:hypothetical protein CRG98_050295 [Punica granatum]